MYFILQDWQYIADVLRNIPSSKNTGSVLLCGSGSSTPYTFCGQTPQKNTSFLCWHLLFAQCGSVAKDAITQFNYHVEFNGVATQQSVAGSVR